MRGKDGAGYRRDLGGDRMKDVSRGDAEDAESGRTGRLWRDVDEVSGEIVDAALKVHRGLGPGLLESVYEMVLARELIRRGLRVERQAGVSFDFDGMHFDDGFRVDLLVEGVVVVELKSVETLAPVHWKQVLTYLKLLELSVGLLINFGGVTLKGNVHRIANGHVPNPSGPARLRVNRPESRSPGAPELPYNDRDE